MTTKHHRFAISLTIIIIYSLYSMNSFLVANARVQNLAELKEHSKVKNADPLIQIEHIQEIVPPKTLESSMKDIDIYIQNDNYSLQNTTSNIWPSWKNDTIQIQAMLDFIHRLLVYPKNDTYTITRKIDTIQMTMFIETPYIVSQFGIYSSQTIRKQNMRGQLKHRLLPVEGLMNRALQLLLLSSKTKERQSTWPELDALLIQQGKSFPFLAYFGDHLSCDYNNYQDKNNNNRSYSLPLFTFGIQTNKLQCWNGFPMATYKMIRDAKHNSEDWDRQFEKQDLHYPWSEKIPKVIWRGTLSDGWIVQNGETPRSKLVALANNDYNNTDLFDIGFSDRRHFEILKNSSLVYTVKDAVRPFAAQQKYIAIIDLDGNAWSSRFPTQLCHNSVTLKVEPRFSDYFMGTQVKPFVHYIPVQSDLSDLLEKTLWVMLHPEQAMQIVENARNWCREHMIWDSIALDLLNSWEKYVMWTNDHDPSWYHRWEKQWKQWTKWTIPRSSFQAFKVSQNLSYRTLSGKFPSS